MKRNRLRNLLALCLFATADAPATVLYVGVNNANLTSLYTRWNTDAATIQDAVGFASRSANPAETHL